MPVFEITEKQLHEVKTVYEIEAENAEEAQRLFDNGEGTLVGQEICDHRDDLLPPSIKVTDLYGDSQPKP